MIVKEAWRPKPLLKSRSKNSVRTLMTRYEDLSEDVLSLDTLVMRRANLDIITTTDYKNLLLTNPSNKYKKELNKAVAAIEPFIKDERPILVWGDYDVDGMTATASLVLTLQELDKNVRWFIPNRELGYGLNVAKALEMLPEKSLIITVDTGIAEIEEIKQLKELGYTIVMTDHHLPQKDKPNADVLLDPKLYLNEKDAEYMVSGCFVGAQIGLEIIRKYKSDKFEYYKKILSSFIALSIESDMIDINKEIRVQLDYGLLCLNNTQHNGLLALMVMCGMRVEHEISSQFISFMVNPKLNAAGRMNNVQKGMNVLLCVDDDSPGKAKSRIYANELRSLNSNRKIIEAQIYDQITDEIRENVPPAIVVYSPEFHAGVVGIVASRLVERYHVPTLILTGDDIIHGSGRAPDGIDLFGALDRCKDSLIQFGGHRVAAGLALKHENLDAFTKKFIEAVRQPNDTITFDRYIDAEITIPNLYDVRFQLFLWNFGPYGNKNEPVNLLLSNVTVAAIRSRGETSEIFLKDRIGFTVMVSKFRAVDYEQFMYKQVDVLLNAMPVYFTGSLVTEWKVIAIRLANGV